jgi:deazaflavin-dependent oxidoreductase (nitroreductase family)
VDRGFQPVTVVADLTKYASVSNVKLTTIGRASGKSRTVTIWFIIADANHVHVQHSSRAPAQWYKNLLKNPEVQVDFGDGPLHGRATAVTDASEVARIQKLFRDKYWMYWLFQLLGRGKLPMVATIQATAGND